mgnify:CR=1 FL=1
MQFQLTEDEAQFANDVETFIKAELPPGYQGPQWEGGPEHQRVAKEFTDKLAKKGWLAPAWPVEYGGLGLSHWKQMLYKELISYHRAPLGQSGMGVSLVGPTLIVYGTEEQKKEHLGAILRNEEWWAQGFSEPNAGSDLASLQTRATLDGDEFVVNGTKIWTSGAQYASKLFLLARTDPDAPKHRGISFLLTDIKAPGITVQPLVDMTGGKPFNQVFFEEVRIPKQNLVGEYNRGWYVAATLLDFERSGVEWSASSRRLLRDAIDELRSWGEASALKKPDVKTKLANMAIECEVARWLAYRVTSMQAAGVIPNHEASISKLFGSELTQHLAQTLVEIHGPYGQLRNSSTRARLHGRPADSYLSTVPLTILAGSSEIQKGIIAGRGLGLPRQ